MADNAMLGELYTTKTDPKMEKVGVNPVPVEDVAMRPIDMNSLRPVVKLTPDDIVVVQYVETGKFDIMSKDVFGARFATPTEKNVYRNPQGQLVEIVSTDKGHLVLNSKANYMLASTDEQYFAQRFTKI